MIKVKKIRAFFIIMLIIFTMVCNMKISNATAYNQSIGIANFSNNNGIDLFPESYQVLLKKLVDSTGHTNWKFRPLNTDINWEELVANETDCLHNTIYKSDTSPYPSSWYDSCNKQGDKRYYCASKEITSYYMDPRNFLTEKTIFQFLDLSNSSTISVGEIEEIVKGTYLAGSANGEKYSQIIYDAAKESGESAFSIIVRIFQELGISSTLPFMISGTDETYPGVYNFFNYGATDGEGNLARGLLYAQNAGWTTPRKALVEGAKLISSTYTKAGQINKYLYKFDVVGTEKSQLYKHQYMTNVQDPNSQASILYTTYDQCDFLDNGLTFIIPVYKNMPDYVKLPNIEDPNGNLYYISSNYSEVNLRSSPNGSVIKSLRKDTVVTMLQENVNGFGKISCNGTVGYVSMTYLTKLPQNTGVQYLGGSKDSKALVSYSGQIQNIGWTGWAKDGETIGVTDAKIRLETIKITLADSLKSENLQYRAHIQDIGWSGWTSDGNMAGTVGQSKRVEAIQIKLKNSSNYNIKYRVCIEGTAWTNWVQNGETAGTTGQSKMITAIEIKLEKVSSEDSGKTNNTTTDATTNSTANTNTNTNTNTTTTNTSTTNVNKTTNTNATNTTGTTTTEYNTNVLYQVHVQDIGWMNWIQNGKTAGTTGKSKRIEAIKIKLEDTTLNNYLQYRVHVQDIGWMDWNSSGGLAGTTGRSKRIEAIQIKLNKQTGKTIKYRVHVQDIGWMDWVQNGETAGTTGKAKRIEAIEIKIE